MEVIHSTNIVFSSAVKPNTDGKAPKYRKPPSPIEPKVTNSPKPVGKSPLNATKTTNGEVTIRSQNFPASVTDNVPMATSSPLFKPSNRAPDVFGGGAVLDTPLSWKKRESPADSGIELSPISVSPPKVNPKVRATKLHTDRIH